jgi:Gp37 protein
MGAVVLDSAWIGETFAPPTPLDIGTIEAAIVNQLNSQITEIEVVHFPDTPEAYRMTHRIGAALVRYDGGEYGKSIDTAAIVQERTLKFEITVMMRDLGWNVGGPSGGATPGAYSMMEAVRVALTGFRVPGCDKAYPLRERFIKRDKQGGVWIYAISFELRTAAVEASVTENYPLLTTATAQEQGGITTLSLAPVLYQFSSSGQIQLPNANISALPVTNPANGALYTPENDYTSDAVNGIIPRTSTGAIPPDAFVDVAYTYAEAVTAIANGGSAPTAPTN